MCRSFEFQEINHHHVRGWVLDGDTLMPLQSEKITPSQRKGPPSDFECGGKLWPIILPPSEILLQRREEQEEAYKLNISTRPRLLPSK